MNKVLLVGVLAIAVILISVVGFLNYNTSYKTTQTGLKVNLESAPSTGVLLSPVQAQASTGVQGYTVGAWIELSNLSGIAPSGTVTSQFINNISKSFGTTFSEVLVHNSTSSAIVFVSKAVSQNVSTGFRKIALILVAGYNFNVNKSGNMEYVYGNISGTGISLGDDGTYLVGAVVNGVQDPAQSALSLLMNQYQDVVNSQSALVQPPSIFSSVPNMKLALWAYVNYTALKSLNLSGFKMGGIMGLNNMGLNKLNSMSAYSKFQNISRNMKLNVSTGYLALYANSSSLLAVQVTQYKTSSEAQQQYNQTLTFYEQYKDYTGMNAVISQGNEGGSPYFIANPNPMNNNTLILVSVSGPYLITEANYATVASQTLLLSYLQGLLSQL